MKTLAHASLAGASCCSMSSNPSRLTYAGHQLQAHLFCHIARPSIQINGSRHNQLNMRNSGCMRVSAAVWQYKSNLLSSYAAGNYTGSTQDSHDGVEGSAEGVTAASLPAWPSGHIRKLMVEITKRSKLAEKRGDRALAEQVSMHMCWCHHVQYTVSSSRITASWLNLKDTSMHLHGDVITQLLRQRPRLSVMMIVHVIPALAWGKHCWQLQVSATSAGA